MVDRIDPEPLPRPGRPLYDWAFFFPRPPSAQSTQQHSDHSSEPRRTSSLGKSSALHSAIKGGQDGLTSFLLQNDVDVNTWTNGYRPLHLSVSLRNLEITKLLLDHKADTDSLSSTDRGLSTTQSMDTNVSPLHIVTKTGDMEIAKLLLEAGANVNIFNPLTFETPLLLAVTNQHYDMAKMLLDNNANPEGHSHSSHSPLIQAVSYKNKRLVELLCNYGADLNQRDEDGDPAIHTAAAEGSEEIIQFLLHVSRARGGPALDLSGGSGRPAWWYAERSGHHHIANMLKSVPEAVNPGREYPKDISDDSSRSVSDIGLRKLLDDISLAQRHIYRPSPVVDQGGWKRRLRFVVEAKTGSFYDYEVIEPFRNSQDDQEPFLAISYCWASQDTTDAKTLLINVPDISSGIPFPRALRVRPDILAKGMDFARSRGIRRVWIDQECIHQDNDEDKAILVSSMHRLYQQATLTLAILGNHIKSEDDIKAVHTITSKRYSDKYNATQESSHLLSSRIFSDRWFERAWTAQEAIITGITNLVYLVGWEQNLDRDGVLWETMRSSVTDEFPIQNFRRGFILDGANIWSMAFVPRESRVSPWTFAAMQRQTSIESFHLSEWFATQSPHSHKDGGTLTLPDTKQHKRRSNADFSTYKKVIHESPPRRKHQMAITTLLRALVSKGCLMTLDRLSIIGNLAQYEHHLDMGKLVKVKPDISYTACLLALALANGDVSLLTEYGELRPSLNSSTIEGSWIAQDKTIRAGRPVSGRTLDGRRICICSPCAVVNSKLVVKGILWKVDVCQDLLPLQKDMLRMIEYCRDHPTHVRLIGVEVLKAALRELFAKDKTDMVGLLFGLARQERWESPEECYETIEQLKNWYYQGGEWPHLPIGYCRGDKSSLETDLSCLHGVEILPKQFHVSGSVPQGDDDVSEVPQIWGDDLLRHIYSTVVRGTPFAVGTFGASKGKRKQTAIFNWNTDEYNTNFAKQVFVPMAELDYQFKGESFMEGPASASFWQVQTVKEVTVSDNEIQEAKNRIEGIYNQSSEFLCKKSILRIVLTKDLLGIWSPLVSSDGILERSAITGLYSMLPLDIYYYFIT